mgnify:CR=1 FL=1
MQMRGARPGATGEMGRAGAKDAAYLAAQFVSLADDDLSDRVKAERAANSEKVQAQDAALQSSL